jgi:addiction module RelE/StbE family toxin
MTSNRARVELTKAAQKDLKKLRHDLNRAIREIMALETNPTKGHTLRGSLSGARALEFSLKGGGAFRAIYHIVDEETIVVCVVFMVGPHENIYRMAQSRYEALIKGQS